MKKTTSRWTRVLRLTVFSLFFAVVLTNFGTSWLYLRPLLHPPCNPLVIPMTSSLMPITDRIVTHDGYDLPIYYYPAQNGAAIIITSALGGTAGLGQTQARFLLEAGYGVLLVESRSCIGLPVTLGYHEGLDVPNLSDYLMQTARIEAGRIGVMGFSMGGAAAVMGAAQTPAIGAVMQEGNYHNLGALLVPENLPWYRKVLFYPVPLLFWAETGVNPWLVSPIDAVAKLSPRPVFMIYGSEEIEGGHGYAQYEAAGQPKDLWVVPGGTHGGNYALFPKEYEQRLLDFFAEYLE